MDADCRARAASGARAGGACRYRRAGSYAYAALDSHAARYAFAGCCARARFNADAARSGRDTIARAANYARYATCHIRDDPASDARIGRANRDAYPRRERGIYQGV